MELGWFADSMLFLQSMLRLWVVRHGVGERVVRHLDLPQVLWRASEPGRAREFRPLTHPRQLDTETGESAHHHACNMNTDDALDSSTDDALCMSGLQIQAMRIGSNYQVSEDLSVRGNDVESRLALMHRPLSSDAAQMQEFFRRQRIENSDIRAKYRSKAASVYRQTLADAIEKVRSSRPHCCLQPCR